MDTPEHEVKPNPNVKQESTSPQPEEYLVQSWLEPSLDRSPLNHQSVLAVVAGAAVLFVSLVALGYFQHNTTYYIGAVAALAAAGSLVVQGRGKEKAAREIILTNLRLIVAGKPYMLDKLAGFWLEAEDGHTVVNVEQAKATLLPITFLHTASDLEAARSDLVKVLSEVEPRQKNFSDQLNSWFKL